jgi:16S rRNA (uracil1498-N3)-methyltransferase
VHRFYIPPDQWDPGALVLTGTEAHHARDVLRMKRGEKAVLFNGRGREITAELLDSDNRSQRHGGEIRFRKLHESETPPLRCRITLGQAIPKGKNMELIVQKAVEIGASEIAPLISERTIIHLDPKEAARKQSKWQQIAIEAAKQCGQNWLPQVDLPRTLKEFFSDSDAVAAVDDRRIKGSGPGARGAPIPQLRLIGSLQPDAQHLKKIFSEYSAQRSLDTSEAPLPQREDRVSADERPRAVLMLIGPEGDFTPAELALAKSHGCIPITLGPIILRVETAAIYCLSVLSYELLS